MFWSHIVALLAAPSVINLPIKNIAQVLDTATSHSKPSQYENVVEHYEEMIVELRVGTPERTRIMGVNFLSHENVLMDATLGCDTELVAIGYGHHRLTKQGIDAIALDPRVLTTFKVEDGNDNGEFGGYSASERLAIGTGKPMDVMFRMVDTCEMRNSMGFAMSPLRENKEEKEGNMNLVQKLKAQDSIRTAIASFMFPQGTDDEGSLLIGGLDHSKYTGTLGKMQIVNSKAEDGYTRTGAIEVVLDGISTEDAILEDAHHGVKLTTLSWSSLPEEHLKAIANEFGGNLNQEMAEYTYDKDILFRNEALIFSFGGVPINVPIRELAYECAEATYCLSLGRKVHNQISSIGLDVLKHAYLVIDYENNEVALAQAVHKAWKLPLFEEATAGIPSATKAPGYASRIVNFFGKHESVATGEADEGGVVLNKRATSGATAKTTNNGPTTGAHGGTTTGTPRTTSLYGNTPTDTGTGVVVVSTGKSTTRTSTRTTTTSRTSSFFNTTSRIAGASPMKFNVGENYHGVSFFYLYMGVIAALFLMYA